MWTESGENNMDRMYQVDACEINTEECDENTDIFRFILNQEEVPLYQCSKARFAAMCVCYSKGNHT